MFYYSNHVFVVSTVVKQCYIFVRDYLKALTVSNDGLIWEMNLLNVVFNIVNKVVHNREYGFKNESYIAKTVSISVLSDHYINLLNSKFDLHVLSNKI